MTPVFVTLLVFACFALGYRFYARFVGERIFGDRDDVATPAHTHRDEVDYVPTDPHVLFGHHFTSIAGAAPIIGPCVAAYWGWLPAILWVVFGTLFMGAVHDFGALVISAREGGRSIGDIAAKVMGKRARILFLCFVAAVVWLVLAVFAMAIAGLFVSTPSSVLPIQSEIVLAVIVGWLVYRKGVSPLWPSVVALVVLYALVWVGTRVPIDLGALGVADPRTAWLIFLFAYSAVASLLPVWLLLQPRDFINSHQLVVGLVLLFVGLFVAHPEFDAPAVRVGADAPSVFPLLFVTIACGAISGFHGLVSSGTTSKQLDRLAHARTIGYGAMLGEGVLALAATLAAVAGIALVGACELPSHGAVADLGWATYYDTWSHAGANKAAAFVLGGGAFLEALGLPTDLARTVMAVLVISFAATTLDTATRIQRFIVAELGEAIALPVLKRPTVATAIAILPALALCFGETTDAAGQTTQVGWVLWPIFGASNQMLAALTLMVLALYFGAKKKPVLPLVIPMLLVTAVALMALLAKLEQFLAMGDDMLVAVTVVLLAMVVWMLTEGAMALRRRPGAEADEG
ncbi:MAG: carbon starvation protein A [Sandaracinus sp.]|nr:carbon starvation protein A [Sandaracinus sp.]|tara:strand:- start:639 stop:2360 length:1722 start_codon:yes stop_codon:yes gene_type:complete